MTALESVRRARRILAVTALTEALAWGIAVALAIVATISFASFATKRANTASAMDIVIAVVLGAFIASALLWRSRHFVSTDRVALWIEERVPELHYSLVTALEHPSSPFVDGMEQTIARQNLGGAALGAVRRGLMVAGAALLVAVLLLYVSPSTAFGRPGALSRFGRLGISPKVATGSRLNDISAVITPPAYTGARSTTLNDPSSIAALTSSRIEIRGDGSPSGVTAELASPVNISAADGGWTLSILMPAKPTALKLRDRNYERIIVLAPRADNPPTVALSSPLRDTTLRTPRLTVHLDANASDDIGLTQGYFEYLVTTGSGEIFSARTITTPVVHFDGSRNGRLSATLDLASLKLAEGDVVSMRAIVQDGNVVSGPAIATSDTRTIRLARASEYDSLSIEAAAPPPLDSSATSQRMLIAMTETLVREQPKLTRAEIVKRSTDIGDLEDRIRRRVHELLSGAEEESTTEQPGGAPPTVEEMEAPEVETGTKNPDLVSAYNALWQAVRSLQIAEPAPALPPMRAALIALDRARVANRLYLRGAPPRIIVDLARVRLSGTEKGSSSTRMPRSFTDSLRVRLAARFSAVLELVEKDPARAMNEMALMRVEALKAAPNVAAALGEATDAIRAGHDATQPLIRARRALNGAPESTPGLPEWSGGE
jgi:uncharacterized protein DUF4175